jgi:hypothetical protein
VKQPPAATTASADNASDFAGGRTLRNATIRPPANCSTGARRKTSSIRSR